MEKKVDRQKGSVTIEATISLTTFIFAVMTILSVLQICTIQSKLATAANTTARELSQYSYLYSLTGLLDAEKNLADASAKTQEDAQGVMKNINEIYNEIEGLGQTGKTSMDNLDDLQAQWSSSLEKIKDSGSQAASEIEKIAGNPKQLMFGLAQVAISEGLEIGKSKFIAPPICRALIQKHLVSEKNGSVEETLKRLHVVPGASGSYLDGLDFSGSKLFPYGSNLIVVDIVYKARIIQLLPIKTEFTFHARGSTYGWLAGDVSFAESEKILQNHNPWTDMSVEDRARLIRSQKVKELEQQGYMKMKKGPTDVQLFNPENKEFICIKTMNPLYSGEGEEALTLDDLSEVAIREQLLQMTSMSGRTQNLDTVTVKNPNKNPEEELVSCRGAKNKVVLVIPEDKGLKDYINNILSSMDTNGVQFEVIADFGNGARSTVVEPEPKPEEENNE